jgi:hypothetical protein
MFFDEHMINFMELYVQLRQTAVFISPSDPSLHSPFTVTWFSSKLRILYPTHYHEAHSTRTFWKRCCVAMYVEFQIMHRKGLVTFETNMCHGSMLESLAFEK